KMSKQAPFERFLGILSLLNLLANSKEFRLLNAPETRPVAGLQRHDVRLKTIFQYVEQHYDEPIDTKKMAALTHMTIPAFCNYFKKVLSVTFTDFVNQYRIQQSCILLRQGKSITETCFSSGFNNIPYFNKVFKKITGKTPSEFRKVVVN
ncbi:MAG: helix-turn-helix transcriptional regulator, partial [Gemmatimonadaceae bacterium]|nr:helix-turn-helix transcriptional regulator [Chitinophagaceae bacterium]